MAASTLWAPVTGLTPRIAWGLLKEPMPRVSARDSEFTDTDKAWTMVFQKFLLKFKFSKTGNLLYFLAKNEVPSFKGASI